MAHAPPSPEVLDFVAHVSQAYEKLIASPHADPESGLGGRLFYAGELEGAGRALVVAANIAGAATLVATADRSVQKQAIRDGVVDFLVTSLDEALRVLKNQLRKRETVSVCVAMDQSAIVREMNERGVQPDLLRQDVSIAPRHEALLCKEDEVDETDLTSIPALVVWRADSPRHQDQAVLDEIAFACLDAEEWAACRWLRLAPRYLGRLAHGMRLVSIHREFVARFAEQLRARVDRRDIAFPYEIRWYVRGIEEKQWFEAGQP